MIPCTISRGKNEPIATTEITAPSVEREACKQLGGRSVAACSTRTTPTSLPASYDAHLLRVSILPFADFALLLLAIESIVLFRVEAISLAFAFTNARFESTIMLRALCFGSTNSL